VARERIEPARRRSAADVEADWAARVRADHEQVDRVREVPDGADFYAPVRGLFVADPRRSGDAPLDALLALARADDTWLDVGAGAGRYALPLALAVREVVAVESSPAMAEALRAGMAEHGIANIRVVDGVWPPDDATPFAADVGLIAHIGYDIEAIGPFLDAFEAASRRSCVALMLERQPASLIAPFWPPVHSEERVPLPALPEFLELLESRGRRPTVRRLEQGRRTFGSRDDVAGIVRRQLWVEPGGTKDRRAMSLLDEWLMPADDGSFALAGSEPLVLGIVTWDPGR
jgi:SAM-dependent methyltransferase